MKTIVKGLLLLGLSSSFLLEVMSQGITPIPNQDFEDWVTHPNYSDPLYWDTPNEEISAIPFFGVTVVSKSTDHQSGAFSAQLESKEVLFVGEIPGFMTCGTLSIDIATLSFEVTGGAPVYDMPTHLKGYYKYFPKGGDSCAIGIGLFKTIGDSIYTVGIGQFSTKDTVSDWTYFSAWIDYDTILQPDTMNIIALSSAQEDMTPGTLLFVDNLFLDYTVRINPCDPEGGIHIYNDIETKRLLVFFTNEQPELITINLYNLIGNLVSALPPEQMEGGRRVLPYSHLTRGIYVLEVIHEGQRFVKKIFLEP